MTSRPPRVRPRGVRGALRWHRGEHTGYWYFSDVKYTHATVHRSAIFGWVSNVDPSESFPRLLDAKAKAERLVRASLRQRDGVTKGDGR